MKFPALSVLCVGASALPMTSTAASLIPRFVFLSLAHPWTMKVGNEAAGLSPGKPFAACGSVVGVDLGPTTGGLLQMRVKIRSATITTIRDRTTFGQNAKPETHGRIFWKSSIIFTNQCRLVTF